MIPATPDRPRRLVALALACFALQTTAAWAGPKPEFYWRVDDVRAGMKGTGRTVMRGTKVETFEAEVEVCNAAAKKRTPRLRSRGVPENKVFCRSVRGGLPATRNHRVHNDRGGCGPLVQCLDHWIE